MEEVGIENRRTERRDNGGQRVGWIMRVGSDGR